MSGSEKPACTREDLRIVINVPSYWGVDLEGAIDLADSYGEGEADADNFDAYHCDECEEWFTGERADAWEAALAHITQAGAA